MGTSQSGTRARVSIFYSPGTWIEGRAEDQLHSVADWPGITAVAGFPDLHPGRHGPVGAAFLADRIYPQLIGPDIGCGMALFALDLPRRKLRLDRAARRLRALEGPGPDVSDRLRGIGLDLTDMGLGTIGGGNHFCELQTVVASDHPALAKGGLCLLVHSGSRGVGAGVFQRLEGRWDAGFDPASEAGRAYRACHDGAVAWAALNRRIIAERAAEALRCDLSLICDAPHNLLAETPGGWLHRKGAAAADKGLAPLAGSRETESYLLAVDPPPAALASVSHGAGRRYDRASMHGRLRKGRADMAAMARTGFGGHVICEDRDLMIEEAGMAYKDPAQVVGDLTAFHVASPVARMQPLLTFKRARAQS